MALVTDLPPATRTWKCSCGNTATTPAAQQVPPVGWAVLQLSFSQGGEQDYDDCRRMGYQEPVNKTVCNRCAAEILGVGAQPRNPRADW